MTYHAIGLMSGSSLDGLDIAFCRFETAGQDGQFHLSGWEILAAETLPFSDFWKKRLRDLPSGSAFELADAHAAFGGYLGYLVQQFFASQNLSTAQIDLIASHGHTILHEPAEGFTTQIGDGAALAIATGCTIIADFRTADVALGGQGAPLAPLADKYLLPEADFYLNLGGIANLTCDANPKGTGGKFVAFDVTGVNQILNALTQKYFDLPYDANGDLARSGKLDVSFLEKMNTQAYFDLPYPKSLSNQWVQNNLVKLALDSDLPPAHTGSFGADLLHTTCVHVGRQLAKSISNIIETEDFKKEKYRLIPSGGGVFNSFLMECIQKENPNVELVNLDGKVADFKEAALMALMGVMRMEGVPNCISSVTGAERDAVGGAVFMPS